MSTVTIYLAKALICFSAQCHPVLLGEDTRPGVYQLRLMHTAQPGYGGNVMVFDRTPKGWYAIHRTYAMSARRTALYPQPASARRYVSNGCPNVQPQVYDQLRACCSNSILEIKP